jgi:hypothetical protein
MSEHVHLDPSNKRVAMLIAVLALFLAICETLSKGYQTDVITKQVEASNLWAFYQAKSIRQTATQLALESATVTGKSDTPVAAELIAKWEKDIKRYGSEPETGEGRKELMARAKKAEAARDDANHRYHNLEIASGMMQVGIVLASAAVLTSMMILAWIAGGLGVVATGIAIFAMTAAASH